MLIDYNISLLNKVIKNDNSLLFWPRQTGKSTLLSYYIENFVENNNNQDIIFFNDDREHNKYSKSKLIHDICNVIVKKKYTGVYEMSFKNENFLTFCSIQESYEHTLFRLKPSIIIYDNFHHKNLNNYRYLFMYLNLNNCKSIFTSNSIDTRVIKALDYKNNYYINIRRNNSSYESYNYDFLIKKELSYKPDELLDFNDTIYQRRKKLQVLNKISNGI